jgi:hypothetical protein
VGETFTLWQGKAGQFEKVLSEPADSNPHVSFWFPFGPAVDRPWYVSLGSSTWKISSRSGEHSKSTLEPAGNNPEMILNLTGTQDSTGQVILYANTGQHIYRSVNNRAWSVVYDFGDERAVGLVLSSSFQKDKTAFALLLGGTFCKIQL